MQIVKSFLRSRKFLLLLLDLIVTAVLVTFGETETVTAVVAALQPVFLFAIGAIALEDAAAKRAGIQTPDGDSFTGAVLGLLRSRKFWLLLVDAVATVVITLVNPTPQLLGIVEQVHALIIAIITAIAVEDAAAKRAGNFPGMVTTRPLPNKR